MRRTAVAIGVLVALLAPAPADSQAKRSVPRGFYGVFWDGKVKDKSGSNTRLREWDRMVRSGVESVRTTFDWAAAQRGPELPVSFGQTDPLVRLAATHDIELLPVVTTPPRWARGGQAPYSAPVHPSDYAAYVVALIGRYGPQGSYWASHPGVPRKPIRAWEIWNEPPLDYYYGVPAGEDWAASYGKLLRVSHDAIKAADPGARVVLAGLPNASWDFLRALYERGDVKGNFDVAAVHPYTSQRHGVIEIVRRFRKVMADKGDGDTPLWVTELGLPAAIGRANSSTTLQTSDDGMKRFLTEAYTDLVAGRKSSTTKVDRAYWYTWASSYTGNNIWNYSGLLQHTWTTKREEIVPMLSLRAYRNSALAAEGRQPQ
jgi:hypothetical protein